MARHRQTHLQTCRDLRTGSRHLHLIPAVMQVLNHNRYYMSDYLTKWADPGLMEYRRIQICPTCGGSGYDPERTGHVCRNCDGVGLYLGEDPIELPDGNLLILTGEHGAPSELQTIGLPYDFIESTSAWVETVLIMPKDEWTGSLNANAYNYLAVLYFAQSDGPCATCGGSGKAEGDPYVDGDALPVPLVNYLNTEVSFTAEKTLEGQPASEPFTFVLLETDEERRTEKEIARTQNGTDGKITFNPVVLNPATPKTYYYIVREEADAENSTIAYDTGEDIYRVTVSLDNDGIPVVDKKLMSGDGVFRNTYKGGSLAIEVKTGGNIPHWPWWQPPKFPVNVVLKNREGKPLAGHPLPTLTQKVQLSAKAGNDTLTVSDVMTRAESTAGNMTDSEGRGTIMIEGGSVATITGLPDGVTYEVSQPESSMPKGFSQSSAEGTTGTIRAGQESRAILENTYKEEDPPKPSEDPPKPSEEPPKPSEDPPKPSEEPLKPSEDPPKPSEEPPKPSEDPPKPSEEPPKPSEDPPKPSEEPPKPSEEPPKPTGEPTKSPKTTDEPIATGVITPKVTPTATPTATPKAAPTATPTATQTVTPTATPTATSTPTSTEMPIPTATPTSMVTAPPTATPSVNPMHTPAPTNNPKPHVVPKTGDADNPLLWVGLILIGLIGIGGLTLGKYRKKK